MWESEWLQAGKRGKQRFSSAASWPCYVLYIVLINNAGKPGYRDLQNTLASSMLIVTSFNQSQGQ